MYIGGLLKQRMNLLGYTDIYDLSKDSLVATDVIEDILDDKMQYEDIDKLNIQFISEALYCETKYWIDKKVRDKDWIIAMNKNKDITSIKANIKIGELQQFSKDFQFLKNIAEDCEGEGD